VGGSKHLSLLSAASDFAAEISELLNQTICNGVRLSAVSSNEYRTVVVGYGITKTQWYSRECIPLSIGGAPTAHLVVSYRLTPDAEDRYLAVASSTFALSLDSAMSDELFHIDFERGKTDGYPEAHLQIAATSPHWQALSARASAKGRELGRLHFPVGGRRFRPTLEDLIDFLVTERLVAGRPGWEARVEQGRRGFHERQLRAAIRQYPDIARSALAELGTAGARA
jgi:hypothetical protein